MDEPASSARRQLEARAQRGFKGYPVGTVAYYGPDNQFASKVAVGIILKEGGEAEHMEKWLSPDIDVRKDASALQAILELLDVHRVRSVVLTPGIYGCPHEEGIDYPKGKACPHCPFWAG
ncbi:hypothetical protein ACFL6M_07385, partial [Candidatus Eisenbacteria bacterium]